MKRVMLLLLFSVCANLAFSQKSDYSRKKPDIFPRFGEYSRQGWYVLPGVTCTQGFGTTERSNVSADSLLIYRFKPTGAIGAYLQVGRFHAPRKGIVSYFDYGIDFRLLRGRHNFSSNLSNELDAYEYTVENGSGRFSEGWLGLNANASHVSNLSDRIFLVNALGINAHVNVLRKTSYTPNSLDLGADVPSIFLGQIHYQFGVGFKMRRGLYIIPTFETPIFGVWDFNSGIPSMRYFNTYNQPLLLGVKFMWLSKNKPDKCPVDSKAGKKGKVSKETLFEQRVNKKYRW